MALALLEGCSEDPPSIRVRNDYTKKANVQMKVGGANTININDVTAGATTNYQDISEGTCEVSASVAGETANPTATFNAETDMNYTVVVTNTTPPALRVDSEDK
jgi:hypothetical protein